MGQFLVHSLGQFEIPLHDQDTQEWKSIIFNFQCEHDGKPKAVEVL
jgi:hypothetical protein